MKKLILLFFLISSLGVKSQIAHYNQYPTMHVDTYLTFGSNASFAYSLRKLKVDYTGPIVQLRRFSDNAIRDFYAKSNDLIDVNEIATWANGARLKVVIWYDQSGKNRNAVQPSVTKQPELMIADPDRPYIETLSGQGNYFIVDNANLQNLTTAGKNGTIFFIINPENRVSTTLFGTTNSNNRWSAHVNWSNGYLYFDPGFCCNSVRNFDNNSGAGVWNQYTLIAGTDYMVMRRSGIEKVNTPILTNASNSTNDFLIGAVSNSNNAPVNYTAAKFTEFIMFKNDISASEYQEIEDNQLAFWPMN